MVRPQVRAAPYLFVYLLSGLLLVLGASGAWYVRHLFHTYTEVVEINVASVRAAEELEIGLREIRATLYKYIINPKDDDRERLQQLRQNADSWLREATRLATTPTEQEIISRVHVGYQDFFKALDHTLGISDKARLRVEMSALVDERLLAQIIEPAHEYLDFNEASMSEAVARQSFLSGPFTFSFLAVGICGCLGGFIAGQLTSRRLKRSLVELNLPLSMAAGKLSEVVGPIRLDTTLDLGELREILELISVEVEKVVNQLQKTQQEIMRSEKLAAIGQLAAGTAHEIRNPLMSIKLLVQTGLENPETSLNHEDLGMIHSEILRLEHTVKNLLEFARPPTPEHNSFPITQLLDHCISLVTGRARIQNVTIDRMGRGYDGTVAGDFQQLQQVLLNMLINSLDALPQGGSIAIHSETDEDSGELRISVIDNGPGIRDDLLPLIFEPFVSSKDSGTGLGLSICKQIIDAHRGRIFAENRQPGGASVGFTLPMPPSQKGQNP